LDEGVRVRDKLTGEPVNTETIFEAASFTKPFFASFVMTLVASGKLALDKPLLDYLPKDSLERYIGHSIDLPGFRLDWVKRITPRMILSHSSGLPHGQRGKPYPILFEPGTRFSYSSDGYYLLQKAIEHILGKPLGEIMKERVIQPLRMDRSSVVWDDRLATNAAIGHTLLGISNGGVRKYFQAHAAASLYSTAGDYAKFIVSRMNGSFPGAPKVDLMLTPQIPVADSVSWGLGFGIEKTSSGSAFFQWGDYEIFRNFIVALPGEKRALVYLTNSYYGLSIGPELVRVAMGYNEDFALRWLHYEPYNTETSRFYYAVAEQPAEEGVRLYNELRSRNSPATDEEAVNTIGYGLLRGGAKEKALIFLELNTKAFPKSANTFDSMGEACETVGDTVRAAACYQKALDLLPGDTTRNEDAKARLKPVFEEHLARVTRSSK
jgi:CubicO group peptidase (beta-lactamase class C family)